MAQMTPQDARAILGLSEDSTAQCLRLARRALVRAHHPDLVPRHRRAQSDRKLAQINTAFDVLIAIHSTRGRGAQTPNDAPEPASHQSATGHGPARSWPHATALESALAPAPARSSNQAPNASAPTSTPRTPRTPRPASQPNTSPTRRARDAFEAGLRAVSRAPNPASRSEYA